MEKALPLAKSKLLEQDIHPFGFYGEEQVLQEEWHSWHSLEMLFKKYP